MSLTRQRICPKPMRARSSIATAGLRVDGERTNDYNFVSERALDACSTYGVESISFAAVKEA